MPAKRSTRNRPQPPFGDRPPFGDGPPLGFLLTSVGFGTALRFRSVIAPTGMHPREFGVLRTVAMEEGISQQACGHTLKVAPSQMVALVDALESKGLLERRPDPADRRVRALHVTTKGRRALATGFEAAMRNEEQLFGALSSTERAELRRLLQQVADALGLEPGQHPGMSED
jgi:DNA-binding MarR family transcriptional regulator